MSVPAALLSVLLILPTAAEAEQALSGDSLTEALREGGLVIVMRHASSPREEPDEEKANADNVGPERQLDAEGRRTAAGMGEAVRRLGIPIGDVLSSPTYRTLETARLAGFPEPQVHAELGDRGRSMQGVTDADAAWLRTRAAEATPGTNTLIVTHNPNIQGAFPEVMPAAADGESLVLRPDGQGATALIGRIRIQEWPDLR